MKKVLLLCLTLLTLNAENFSKQKLMGLWELSSSHVNSTVVFGTYIGKQRAEVLEMRFNPQGVLQVEKGKDLYNYEVVKGELMIYVYKKNRNSYELRYAKSKHDLFKIVGKVDGCLKVKVVKKKIPGYKSRYDLKMCKISNYPKATYQDSISNYKF